MSLAEEILSVLHDPTYMWSHALREASQDSQRLFLTLPFLPQPISTNDLQVAYSTQRFNQTETFLDSLRALEDSFISIDVGGQNRRWVNFRNPSLQDFSHKYLNKYTDWLNRILSNPTYYEQVINVYNLAMSRLPGSRTVSAGPPHRLNYHEGELRFTEIRSWVTSQHHDLISEAINLALSRSEVRDRYKYVRQDFSIKLKELVEIILTFGEPSEQSTIQVFGELINRALRPTDEPSADSVLDLLRVRKTAKVVEKYSTDDAMEILRTNILDLDEQTWRFSVLSKIDEFLGIDYEESMDAWGHDYIRHLDEFVDEMMQSSDYEDIDNAINEMRGVSSLLGIDLYDSISVLESHRDSLPPDRGDGDYERYSTSQISDSSSSHELDNVFASLLE
jgi:hypothetical protein